MRSAAERSLRCVLLVVLAVAVPAAPSAARAGTITVPLDRADPAAGNTRVAYLLIPSP